ncbi:MAG: hypothetical protein KC619_15610 [Myxococcales bacterium]|nr:hypothetical protein [Myxococcales bacterium]
MAGLLEEGHGDSETGETAVHAAYWGHRWTELLELLATRGGLDRHLRERARAYLELERWAELDRALEQARAPREQAEVAGLHALGLLRRSRVEPALDAAERGVVEHAGHHHYLLEAARLDALDRLGRGAATTSLEPRHVEIMRRLGFGAWVERVRRLMAQARRR